MSLLNRPNLIEQRSKITFNLATWQFGNSATFLSTSKFEK